MKTLPNTATTGVAIMVVAMLIAPFMDLFAKLATAYVVPGEAALGRFIAQSIFLMPFMTVLGEWGRPRPAHAIAGLCAAVAIMSINMALVVMPIANAIAIFFVEPLILTVLSALILKEKIGWRRLSAVAIGLVGAMVVLRPNLSLYGWAAVYPLITALGFAGYMIVMRAMSPGGGRIGLQFWIGVVAALVLGIVHGAGTLMGVEGLSLTWPEGHVLWLFAAAGGLACLTHQLIAQALARAEAAAVAPLQYLEIVTATGIGLVIFGDFPDRLTLLGTLIIVGSGIYVFRREQQLARGDG